MRFFNPRIDQWTTHFELSEGYILGKTAMGQATVNIFRFNAPQSVEDRRLLIQAGRYPYR